jgi:uncharacterized membrane protein (UPF0127 family)
MMRILASAIFAAMAWAASADATTATTADECTRTDRDTRRFVRAATSEMTAPAGRIALVRVELHADLERGLMCVTRVPRDRGMLFVLPEETVWPFWMKNTLVPLDIVYVQTDGVVSEVAAGVPATPLDAPDSRIAKVIGLGRYVIEIGAGDAARHAIRPGTRLDIPH